MRRALIAGFDIIQQFIYEIPRFMGLKKPDLIYAPMPTGIPIYEKDRVVEYRDTIDFTRKLSDS